ncbi:hypothetical protein BDZ97DRAFT_1664914 [Flammula alnicola]|nr:hypothetical protein BDZ97DRAFT_1664914 [Flammula alnicola]
MSQYIDRKEAQKSYRPVAGSMSPGLKRAREPYRLKNALLGITLGAFAVGIWAYSISAVKQDVFDDVDEEVQVLASTSTSQGVVSTSAKEEQPIVVVPASTPAALKDSIILKEVGAVEAQAKSTRGVLQRLEHKLPWLLDPKGKTLVWGAPSVDNVGKMSRS